MRGLKIDVGSAGAPSAVGAEGTLQQIDHRIADAAGPGAVGMPPLGQQVVVAGDQVGLGIGQVVALPGVLLQVEQIQAIDVVEPRMQGADEEVPPGAHCSPMVPPWSAAMMMVVSSAMPCSSRIASRRPMQSST